MTNMHQSNYPYQHGAQTLQGYLAYDKSISIKKRPAVLVVHDWSGRNAFACERADLIASLGYVGFAVDMYGDGRTGETIDEKMALMQPLVKDRALLRARILAARDTVAQMENVDSSRIAIIGFCFGGLCALELARSGADIRGTVSFHGQLNKAPDLPSEPIQSKILALHGYSDPSITPDDVRAFCNEMTDAGVDWQMHMYGQTLHGFTNPLAHDVARGIVYNPVAAKRSMDSMTRFLDEVLCTKDKPLS